MTADRSADRHPPGKQVGISARLDREDYDPFEAAFKAAGLSRRQAIIRAIRDWTTRSRHDPAPPQDSATEEKT